MSRVLLDVRTNNTAWLNDGSHGVALHLWLTEMNVPRQYAPKENSG